MKEGDNMSEFWMQEKETFDVIDVREMTNNFLPMILKKAEQLAVGQGLCIVQTFEPKPLYSALANMGYEHETDKISDTEYRSYFYRKEEVEKTYKSGADMPFKPTAIVNFKNIDHQLANITVDFWELIWEKEDAAIDVKTKLLLSLSNAVGANRFRQATRELIKAYAIGATTEEFDEIFSLFIWNQGAGNFSSVIGPSTLYKAYLLIKKKEKAGASKALIMEALMEKFGENNPEVKTV